MAPRSARGFGPRDRGGCRRAVPSRERGVRASERGGDARGGRGSGAGASGRRPWSSHAAGSGAGSGYGYYNGSDDPFGFRTAESARAGDHMRRIHRNIRVLYASLACLGALIYLAPEPPSPVEQAKARRRREMRARGRGEQPALHFVERVNPTLALGSPLYSSDAGKSAPSKTTTSRANDALRDGNALGYEYDYAYEGGGDGGDVPRTPGTSRKYVGDDRSGRPGSRAATFGEAEQRALLRGARVVAEGGGATWRAEREREAASGDLGEVFANSVEARRRPSGPPGDTRAEASAGACCRIADGVTRCPGRAARGRRRCALGAGSGYRPWRDFVAYAARGRSRRGRWCGGQPRTRKTRGSTSAGDENARERRKPRRRARGGR